MPALASGAEPSRSASNEAFASAANPGLMLKARCVSGTPSTGSGVISER